MEKHYYAVIMAGGGGTRLWPLSRQERPKQMLQLFGDSTLFQIAIERLNGLFPPERIMVVTVAEQAAKLQRLCPEIPADNFLIEPLPRGTASVVGLAAVALQHIDPQSVMAILTADHFIENVDLFQKLLLTGYDVAQADQLVTLGISPTSPSTAYGYIQRGAEVGVFQGMRAYKVLRFKEKPDEDTARKMLASGDHDWNSGMFIWKSEKIMAEIHMHMPELAAKLDQISAAWDSPRRCDMIENTWPTIHPETIDYGIMEKAERVAVLPASGLGWNDVGSWDSLFEVLKPDGDGNIILGSDVLSFDTHGSLVSSNDDRRLIVTIGVKNLIIIDTGDALLVCDKDQAQQVRKVVGHLKEKNRTEFL